MKSFTTKRNRLHRSLIQGRFSLLAGGLLAGILSSCSPSETADNALTGDGLVIIPSAPVDPPVASVDDHGHEHVPDQGQRAPRPYYHNFGAVPDGVRASHTYELFNSDPLPLTITRMSPSCGCTVPSIRYIDDSGQAVHGQPSNEPEILVIPPGAKVQLDVHIETASIKDKNIVKLMQVRITTDSQNDPYLTLECSIQVEQAFYVDGEFVSMGNMPLNIGGEGSSELSPLGASGARLIGIGTTPENVSAELALKPIIGRPIWDLNVRVDPPLKLGLFGGQVEVLTESADGEPRQSLFVNLRGAVVPDIRANPARLFFQDFRGGGITSIATEVSTVIPGARFAITKFEKTGVWKDQIDVEFFPRDNPNDTSSAHWIVKATAKPDIEDDRFSGTIILHTDDEQTPEITIVYAGL